MTLKGTRTDMLTRCSCQRRGSRALAQGFDPSAEHLGPKQVGGTLSAPSAGWNEACKGSWMRLEREQLKREEQPLSRSRLNLTWRMKITLAGFILCGAVSAIKCNALTVREALGMIESGNNDRAVGRAGEISRYQIKKNVWRKYSSSSRYSD